VRPQPYTSKVVLWHQFVTLFLYTFPQIPNKWHSQYSPSTTIKSEFITLTWLKIKHRMRLIGWMITVLRMVILPHIGTKIITPSAYTSSVELHFSSYTFSPNDYHLPVQCSRPNL
jgi:hypothetical protein